MNFLSKLIYKLQFAFDITIQKYVPFFISLIINA